MWGDREDFFLEFLRKACNRKALLNHLVVVIDHLWSVQQGRYQIQE